MKKFNLLLITALTVSAFFTSCATTSGGFYQESTGKYAPDTTLTPDNSVLAFSYIPGENVNFTYGQMNNTRSPMNFTVTSSGGVVVFPLVEPGSHLQILNGTSVAGRVTTYYSSMVLNRYYDYDFAVPNEPGLYFTGISIYGKTFRTYDEYKDANIVALFSPKNEEDFMKAYYKQELRSLRTVLKSYKKTAWEPVINARIQELSK